MAFRFYGQFDPPVDRFLFERYFAGSKRPGVFIECGAFDGETESSCKFFEESLGWWGINVEPSPPVFERLVQNRPNSMNINAALASQPGEAIFTGIIHPEFGEQCTNGSLCHVPAHRAYIEQHGWQTKTYTVPTITWRELVASNGLYSIDLLVLDVEGTELDVIAGMRGSPVLPRVFCVEHGHLGIGVVRQAVEPLGYRYDTSRNVNSYFVRLSAWRRLLSG